MTRLSTEREKEIRDAKLLKERASITGLFDELDALDTEVCKSHLLTPEREKEIREMCSAEKCAWPGMHMKDLIREIDALRAELALADEPCIKATNVSAYKVEIGEIRKGKPLPIPDDDLQVTGFCINCENTARERDAALARIEKLRSAIDDAIKYGDIDDIVLGLKNSLKADDEAVGVK